jgi:hypothetical protein
VTRHLAGVILAAWAALVAAVWTVAAVASVVGAVR